eukprot:2608920-Pyramimonas_sp.AAC.1
MPRMQSKSPPCYSVQQDAATPVPVGKERRSTRWHSRPRAQRRLSAPNAPAAPSHPLGVA